MTIEEIISKANAEIGVAEYPSNSNNVKYNTDFYGRKVSGPAYPWCCVFVWWVMKGIAGFPKTASCVALANYFKKEGRFFNSNPLPGDIVFFKFGTNNRWTNHVGIVTRVSGNIIETIEGTVARPPSRSSA